MATFDADAVAKANHLENELHDLRVEAARIGVHVGLAAGFLLTQLIAGRDGAR